MSLIGNANLLASLCVAPLKRAGYSADPLDQICALIADHLVEKALANAKGDTALAAGALLKACATLDKAEPAAEALADLSKRKSSQSVAHYVSPSQSDEHCADCTMFLARIGACSAVEGVISPDGWCTFFEPRAEGE